MQSAIRWTSLGLVALLVITAGIYAQALNGPFLFDDHVHITQNQWLKIDSLSWENIAQAWNSSFSFFPNNRPLAQLSFGINHVFAGLDTWAYKATNLALHLLTGLAVFVFARLVYRAVSRAQVPDEGELRFALLATGFWLLAPMHISTVLYTVQRMAQISTLATLLALSSYIWGRLQIAKGRSGFGWILAAIPLGAAGFLGKENTVLIPLYLLVLELTLLQGTSYGDRRTGIGVIWSLMILFPLLAGAVYFLTHPGLIDYGTRPFTLVERLLTEPRVLWLYLRLLLIPDISRFGLYHDDLPLSTGLLSPPTTILAIMGLLALLLGGLLLRKRYPVPAFAALFFLAAHALESSFIGLEIVFEHRNYLASVGPLMLLAWLIMQGTHLKAGRIVALLGGLLLLSHATASWVRAGNWSSYESFVLTAAENHPQSARSNFMAAQLIISMVANSNGDNSELEQTGHRFLDQGLAADPECINCLFGKVVLALHAGREPDAQLLERLGSALKTGNVGATKVSISQFSYLVKWHQQQGLVRIPPSALEKLFEDALQNPRWVHTGRAGIEAAYRKYHEFVSGDLERALKHANRAIAAWPDQWSYHMHKVDVLRKLGRSERALEALQSAQQLAKHASQQARVDAKREEILEGQAK